MAELILTLNDLPDELRRFGEEQYAAIRRAVKRTVKIDAPRWVQWSIRGGGWIGGEYRQPIDLGDYAGSFRYEMDGDTGVITSLSSPRIKAGVIEFGRRPGVGIPIEPLQQWVQRKLGVTDAKKAKGIAFAISQKHKKQGRPGLFVLRRARPKIIEALRKNVYRELEGTIK